LIEQNDSNAARGAGPSNPGSGSGRRVLVTGATGFIGLEVARQLSEQGRRPRLLVRRRARRELFNQLDAEIVEGDLLAPGGLDRAVEGMDEVIHLAARATFERYRRVRPSIVDGSMRLMQAARRVGVKRFTFASSLLVYGSNRSAIGADTAPAPRIGYGRAKVEAEIALRAAAPREMALGIIRLPHVYGSRSFLFSQLRRGLVVTPGDGRNTHGHLHVVDAARALIAATTQGWTGTLPVADDSPANWNRFFDVLKENFGLFRRVQVPSRLALIGAPILETLLSARGRPTLFAGDTVRGWLLNLPVEPGLLWRELGLRPLHPTIESGIPASLDDSILFRWKHPLLDSAEVRYS
jgi:nucleoside-diphosphate-sugar epimerase